MTLQSPVKEKETFLSPVEFSESITQHRSFESSQNSKDHCVYEWNKGKGRQVQHYCNLPTCFHTPVMRCWGRCRSHNRNQHPHSVLGMIISQEGRVIPMCPDLQLLPMEAAIPGPGHAPRLQVWAHPSKRGRYVSFLAFIAVPAVITDDV